MKKVIVAVFLGLVLLLLNSCGTTYESFQRDNPGYIYYAYACPASNPNIIDGCGLAANNSEPVARQSALGVCGKKYIDCVVVKLNNKNVYHQSLKDKQSFSSDSMNLSSMIDEAKNTCKDLDFEEGTEKFSDCALKLYSQNVELAAKQNQQIVIQGQSSGSNVMTIYDPVRDSNAAIKRGQGLINGTCTLGDLSTC